MISRISNRRPFLRFSDRTVLYFTQAHSLHVEFSFFISFLVSRDGCLPVQNSLVGTVRYGVLLRPVFLFQVGFFFLIINEVWHN